MSGAAPIAVLGAGAWGTALAQLLAAKGMPVRLWAHEAATADEINGERTNKAFLPGVDLDANIVASSVMSDLTGAQATLCVAPAQFMGPVLASYADQLKPGHPLVLCSKGIETGSLRLMTDVAARAAPGADLAVLSGPSFAADVARQLPTAVTLAARTAERAEALSVVFRTPAFRPYASTDLIGAEVGGAVKNVLAIACGMVLGLELGRSAHAATIARGYAEMVRLGTAMGAQAATLTGLCGLGDLVLTCSSEQSRNMSCGIALGRGRALDDIMAERRSVTEGVATAPALLALAARHGVEMPISEAVRDVLSGSLKAREAVTALLSRPLSHERGL